MMTKKRIETLANILADKHGIKLSNSHEFNALNPYYKSIVRKEVYEILTNQSIV